MTDDTCHPQEETRQKCKNECNIDGEMCYRYYKSPFFVNGKHCGYKNCTYDTRRSDLAITPVHDASTRLCDDCKHHILHPYRKCKAGIELNPYIWGCITNWELRTIHTVTASPDIISEIDGILYGIPTEEELQKQHDAAVARQAREQALKEPRDCATCNNNHNAKKYVRAMQACTIRVANKREMDNLKGCCQHCRSMGEFSFDESKCHGYNGNCRKDSCSNFRWWHAKCYCPIIREYDKQKNHGV